jgi:inhibitor of KinA sporulation pathway (predicted exonuclease)
MKRDILLLIDLEATCWKGRPPKGMHNEIIEIGISGIDYFSKEIKFKDSIIVKPKKSEISEFCTELTSITQEMIDKEGVTFEKACKILKEKYRAHKRVWMSWGEYDRQQFERDCKLNKVDYPMGRTHINLKPLFAFFMGLNFDPGVASALEHLDMDFDGVAHRGDDDAYNIARILQRISFPIMASEESIKGEPEYKKLMKRLDEQYSKDTIDYNVAKLMNRHLPVK